jgi:capsular exopolysaccharide synthesis family protein
MGRDQMLPMFRDEDRIIETQFEILRSRSLARRVINILNLQNVPAFTGPGLDKIQDPEEREIFLVDKFLGDLDASRVKKTDLINISFNSPDKVLAQKVANIMAGEYMQFEIDSKNQSFFHIKTWLEKQLEQLGKRVEGSQKKLYEYGEAGDIISAEEKDNIVIQKYIELSGLLTKASAERIGKEAQFKEIREKGGGASPVTNNPLIQGLRQESARQHARVASLQKAYLPGHPKLQADEAQLRGLQSRLNAEIQNLRTSVESDYEAARRAENLLLEALEKQKDKVAAIQKKLVQYKILKRDVETNEELYKGLLSRMKEAAVASTMVPSNVAVIDPAEKPLIPFKPKKFRNMFLAVLVGLMGGVMLAFAIEYFDDTIKTGEEAERICHLPVLGIVPLHRRPPKELPQGERNPEAGLITYQDPRSMVADAIFVVRTSVLLSVPGSPPQAIMITSPNPLEGKTTIASNLAIALAAGGRKVVLVDGDLRRPSAHKSFGVNAQPGLSDVLTGGMTCEQVLQATTVPTLYVMAAGPIPPNPATLLGSTAFKDAIGYLRDEFQHIIIDTPPTMSLPDSRVISSMADAVILVLRHNYTPRETARMTRQMLTQVHADIIGVILNQVSYQKRGYGGYYYRKYHYYYYSSEGRKSS